MSEWIFIIIISIWLTIMPLVLLWFISERVKPCKGGDDE